MDKDEWIRQVHDELVGQETPTPEELKTLDEMTAQLNALQAEGRTFATGGYIDVPLWEDEEELDANR